MKEIKEYIECPKCKVQSLEKYVDKRRWNDPFFGASLKIVGGYLDWRCLKCFRILREEFKKN